MGQGCLYCNAGVPFFRRVFNPFRYRERSRKTHSSFGRGVSCYFFYLFTVCVNLFGFSTSRMFILKGLLLFCLKVWKECEICMRLWF